MRKNVTYNTTPAFKRSKLAKFKTDYGAWLLVLPSLIFIYFFTLRPIFTGMWYSLHHMQGYEILEFCGLQNYKDVLSDTRFIKVLINTLKYVVWSLVLGYLPPVIVAVMLNEMMHGKRFFKFALYIPNMVPSIVTSLLWYYMYRPDASGLLNTLLLTFGGQTSQWLQNEKLTIILIIVTTTWGAFGSSVLMYLAALQGVNNELYEATLLDGAGFIRRIFTVALPRISGIMLLFLANQIICVFKIMDQPLAMTGGGPNNASMSLGLWSYYNGFVSFDVEASLATGVITFLILVVLTSFYHILKNKVEQD